jgi:hypothetical protein
MKSEKTVAVYDLAPCSLVEVDRRFKVRTASTIGTIIIALMEAASTCKTSVYFSKTTRRLSHVVIVLKKDAR